VYISSLVHVFGISWEAISNQTLIFEIGVDAGENVQFDVCSNSGAVYLKILPNVILQVVHASVLVDAQSRRSRGFGYVTFVGEVPDGVSDRDHEVDGRMCGARLYKYN
jgi:hypothetical protein